MRLMKILLLIFVALFVGEQRVFASKRASDNVHSVGTMNKAYNTAVDWACWTGEKMKEGAHYSWVQIKKGYHWAEGKVKGKKKASEDEKKKLNPDFVNSPDQPKRSGKSGPMVVIKKVDQTATGLGEDPYDIEVVD